MHAADCSVFKEFRDFVKQTEKELSALFKSIDKNNDGKISREELKSAFSRSEVTVSNAKLDNFFVKIDTNRDGVITFDEWR